MYQMTLSEFQEKLRKAFSGDRITYHVGLLLADRLRPEVSAVANAAWEAAGMTWDKDRSPDGQWVAGAHAECVLLQRRLAGDAGCEYLAVKL